ncbi:MAG: acyl-CoA dehydrogenase family protein [Acetobacteraceae bacterium]|nr:acyl-CoA dehydrogenase family protein [Acetobacteraceae bacterium]
MDDGALPREAGFAARGDGSFTAAPVERARALGPAIAAAADTVEATRRIPPELATALHAAGMFRISLPRAYGGEEASPTAYLLAMEEVARHDASVAWNIFVGNSAALLAAFLPPDSARAIWADPRAVVAWGPPTGPVCRAVPGGYVVSGRWDFASGCRLATWMGAHCTVQEPDGSLRMSRVTGRPHIRSLLFPAEQARLLDTWHTIGLRGTASDSYEVEEVFVPEEFTSTREDPRARLVPGPLYAFTQQGLYAVGVAGVALGTARAMLDGFMDLAMAKVPRGLARMADDPLVADGVARTEARIGAARAWLAEILDGIYAGAGSDAPISVADRARVRLGCAHAIEEAVNAADWVYRAAGTDAIFPGRGPFERRFRDIHTVSQQIQSRRSHFAAAGAVMLGNAPETFL